MKMKWSWVVSTGAWLIGVPWAAFGLEAISDNDMAGMSGQSGLTYIVSSGTSLGNSGSVFQWTPDAGTTSAATLESQGFQINGIGGQGTSTDTSGSATTSGPFSITSNFDVGSNGTTPALSMNTSWTYLRLSMPSLLLLNASGTPTSYGYGSFVIDGSGTFAMTNFAGLLNGSSVNSNNRLYFTLGSPQIGQGVTPATSYGQIYYRQGGAGSPELIFDKIYMAMGFNPAYGGVFGACGSSGPCGGTAAGLASGGFSTANGGGLYIGSPKLDFNMTYVLAYRPTPSTVGFTTATSSGDPIENLGTFGWTGSFDNAELLLSGGGFWSGAANYNPDLPAGRSQGLNASFHANYDPNFNWVIGEGGGRAILNFGGWHNLPGATWGLNVPNLTLDVVNQGQEPGGLCWGAKAYGPASSCTSSTTAWANKSENANSTPGTYLDLPPTGTALGFAIRDMSLQAYSTQVTLYDDLNNDGIFTPNEIRNFNWGLMYTLGQVDGNVYLYPGNSTANGNGLTADVLLMTQSFANNTYPLLGNSNFMIVDTTTNLGFGLTQANILLGARDLGINLTSSGLQLTTPDLRMQVEGLVAGGPVYTMTPSTFEKMMYVNINLESNNFSLTLSQGTQNGYPYLAFTNHITFADTAASGSTLGIPAGGDGSFISLAEPSNISADFRIADITGDINVINGQIFLISAGDTVDAPDAIPRLQLAGDVQVGSTAGGNALTGVVKFGGAELGTIAIPSGQIYASIMLKPQH